MSRKNIKRYLMLLTAAGVIAVAASGGGTFASFNAEVTNDGNTFATGSIVLSDTVNAGTTCYSSGGSGNVNATGCDAIWNVASWVPGDPNDTEELTLSNTGSINPTALTMWAPLVTTTGSETSGTLVCNYEHYTPASSSNPYVGTGNPCTGMQIQIQEYDSGFNTPTTSCVFPASAVAVCGTNFAQLSTLPDSGSKLTIPGGLNAGASRYFKLTIKYPASGAGDNEYQAEKTHFDLTWHIE